MASPPSSSSAAAATDTIAASTTTSTYSSSSFQRQIRVKLAGAADNDDEEEEEEREYKYTFRGLEESEIGSWATFCASVFSYKSNPPPSSYFERHYYNDPFRVPSYIRVAVYEGGIVASCRIFVRTVSVGRGCKSNICVGGIGEVCTDSNHRRRGLSKQLLKDCIDIMQNEASNFKLSLLHAAPTFFPVYQSAGYTCMTTKWTVVPVNRMKLANAAASVNEEANLFAGAGSLKVRKAIFPNDTLRLMQIYDKFSVNNFTGCIVRSEKYWNEYLAKEMEGSLFVLVDEGEDNNTVTKNDCGEIIVGYLSIREQQRVEGSRIQVRDFGYSYHNNNNDYGGGRRRDLGYEWLAMLLHEAVSNCSLTTTTAGENASSPSSFNLLIPTVVLGQIKSSYFYYFDDDDDDDTYYTEEAKEEEKINSYLDWDSTVSENDHGWMYKQLLLSRRDRNDDDDDDVSIFPGLFEGEKDEEVSGSQQEDRQQQQQPPHLIWPADSF